jgi:hypothetical protein
VTRDESKRGRATIGEEVELGKNKTHLKKNFSRASQQKEKKIVRYDACPREKNSKLPV